MRTLKRSFQGVKQNSSKDHPESLIIPNSWGSRPKRKKADPFCPVIREDMDDVREKLGYERKKTRANRSALSKVHLELKLDKYNADKGYGMFAKKAIEAGYMVIEYMGDLITGEEGHQREEEYGKQEHCYMYYFHARGQTMCLDATKGRRTFGHARYINHSRRAPNLFPRLLRIDGTPRLVLFAGRAIAAGEELFFDYGDRRKAIRAENPWLNS